MTASIAVVTTAMPKIDTTQQATLVDTTSPFSVANKAYDETVKYLEQSEIGNVSLSVMSTLVDIYGFYANIFMDFTQHLDKRFAHYSPSQLLFWGFFICLGLFYLLSIYHWICRTFNLPNVLKFTRNLPIIKPIVRAKLAVVEKSVRKELLQVFHNEEFMSELPEKRVSQASIIAKLDSYKKFDSSHWQEGRISGTIYGTKNEQYDELLARVFKNTLWSNPLHADVFAGVRKMESEIIRMVGSMYNCNPRTLCGSVTSGGTESIFMACKAYRDFALRTKSFKHGTRPEIVVPSTAHAAFEKAASLLNCKLVTIPVNRYSLKVKIGAMEAALNSRTCMLVGSAPQFPHGIIDPIDRIATLGLKYNLPVHVDACLGGFLLPFMHEAGYELDEPFDFRVKGVTSISADPHKYGYAPKGTSVILYSSKQYIHEQYCIQTNWPGGVYASATLPGSRPGALIATCWAAMLWNGKSGYVQATDDIMKVTQYMKENLDDYKGLEIMGDPRASILAFKSEKFNIYILNDKLKAVGWNLNALQFPPAIHICVTRMHTNNKVADTFVRDVKKFVDELVSDKLNASPASGSGAAMYGMCQSIPDRSIVAEVCKVHLDASLGF